MFKFPFTNFHELNLDWVLSVVKKFADLIPPMETAVDDVQTALGDATEAVQKAESAVTSANEAVETANEAKEIAREAVQGIIPNGAVTTPKLADGAVVGIKIANGAVNSEQLYDGAVRTSKIYDGAVTTPKIADNAVTALKIADNAITTAKIANEAVTTAKLAEASVTTLKINDGAITTPKLADESVTQAKLAPDALALCENKRVEINGNWTYFELNNGYKIAWVLYSTTTPINISSDGYGGFRSPEIDIPIPTGLFTDAASMRIFGEVTSFGGVHIRGIETTTSLVDLFITAGASFDTYNALINVLIIGK